MATGGPCSEIIKFGYVEFKSKHLKTFRRRWIVLYGGTWSAPRLVKYTDEKHATQCPEGRHVYYITDVICAERADGKDHAVKLRFASDEREIFFCCDSEAGANEWVYCIQKSMTGSRDVFNADLFQATHIAVPHDVTLRIADVYVTLIKDGVPFLEIPMRTIRKYQMDKDNVFWIETGRSCPIGEGFLYFRSELAQYILTRLHEMASRGCERRQSLPNTPTLPSQAYAKAVMNDTRRPSLSGISNHYHVEPGMDHTSMTQQANPFATAVTVPAIRQSQPGPNPPTRSFPKQAPREDSRRIPLSSSLGRINESGGAWFQSERDQGFGDPSLWQDNESRSQSFSGLQRKKSGTRLVKAEPRPSLPPGHPSERVPYMQMQNKAGKNIRNVKREDGSPYTDMNNPGNEVIPGSNDDYLTPFSTRPEAKHYGEKRNS